MLFKELFEAGDFGFRVTFRIPCRWRFKAGLRHVL